jgi:SAM-dependent methyltransferase
MARNMTWYTQGTQELMRLFNRRLAECGQDLAKSSPCLEIGCGYGRVIRAMSKVIPPSGIYGCDIVEEGARFCSSEFGINYIPCSAIGGPQLEGRFKFIYLISVFTHLDSETIAAMWAKSVKMLAPDGVVLFTTHGVPSLDHFANYGSYWMGRKGLVAESLRHAGHYYEKYKWYRENIGMAWMSEEYTKSLLRTPGLVFRHFGPGELDDHQDVYCYQKTDDLVVVDFSAAPSNLGSRPQA